MKTITENFLEKISSYDIFNNLFPGIVFCYVVEEFTRISFSTDNFWKNLFVYYFIGMILSRIGSLIIEKFLESKKVKNRKTGEKEAFLNRAPYRDYVEASENSSFIKVLNETNNTYRTIIALFVMVIIVKAYDCILYDYVVNLGAMASDVSFFVVCILLAVLFIYSYRKQTNYIRKRVEHYINTKK